MGDFFSQFSKALPDVLAGLWVTVQATVFGALLALVVSFAFGFMAGSRNVLVRGFSRVLVEGFRGTSLYVQLFWLYYALPLVIDALGYELTIPVITDGNGLTPLFCGVLAFGLNYGAYGSEVVRGAINAVPKSQWEATVALNMTQFQRMRRVILPQAWVQMIPSFTNLLIQLLKATPLLWLISVADLTTVLQQLRDRTGETVPAYLVLLAMYFVLAYALTVGMNALERHAKVRLGQPASGGLFRSRSAAATANKTATEVV